MSNTPNTIESPSSAAIPDNEEDLDPIGDIIDYLVRCANISFKNAHVDEAEVKTKDKLLIAHNLFKESATDFLSLYGKYLAPHHMKYFQNLPIPAGSEGEALKKCIEELILYHSDASRHKRVRNRRFQALQKLQKESDYFSDKEMMYRNPLLYEQLVGQYLTDNEIRERDGADGGNLTLLNMILETVDRNEMREKKNIQMLSDTNTTSQTEEQNKKCENENQGRIHDRIDDRQRQTSNWGEFDEPEIKPKPKWGDFDKPDTRPSFKPEVRKQSMISAPERRLLQAEFVQEMYNSFIDGHDEEIDYHSIDNDEQYDDLAQVSQDAEDRYFDSEPTDIENLEEHMALVEVYGKKNAESQHCDEDTLDTFMEHLHKRQ